MKQATAEIIPFVRKIPVPAELVNPGSSGIFIVVQCTEDLVTGKVIEKKNVYVTTTLVKAYLFCDERHNTDHKIFYEIEEHILDFYDQTR